MNSIRHHGARKNKKLRHLTAAFQNITPENATKLLQPQIHNTQAEFDFVMIIRNRGLFYRVRKSNQQLTKTIKQILETI
jgi:hypothetical protein